MDKVIVPLDIDMYKIPERECMFCDSPYDISYMHQIGQTIYALISCSKEDCYNQALHHVKTFETAWALDKQ